VKALLSLFPILAVRAPPVRTGLLLSRLLLLTTRVHKPERDKLRILKCEIMLVLENVYLKKKFVTDPILPKG